MTSHASFEAKHPGLKYWHRLRWITNDEPREGVIDGVDDKTSIARMAGWR
jgi:hypothetical protein